MKRMALAVLVASLLLAGCGKTPDLCVAYCDAVVQWSEQCRAVPYPREACLDKYHSCSWVPHDRRLGVADLEVNCWQRLIAMRTPGTKEIDCARVPEGL